MKDTLYLIALPEEPRSAFMDFIGHSGKAYRCLWSEQHRAMIYDGRELTGAEFDAVAEDIFRATPDQNFTQAVPRRILATIEEKQPAAPADPPKEPEKQKPGKRITPAEPIDPEETIEA